MPSSLSKRRPTCALLTCAGYTTLPSPHLRCQFPSLHSSSPVSNLRSPAVSSLHQSPVPTPNLCAAYRGTQALLIVLWLAALSRHRQGVNLWIYIPKPLAKTAHRPPQHQSAYHPESAFEGSTLGSSARCWRYGGGAAWQRPWHGCDAGKRKEGPRATWLRGGWHPHRGLA